MINFGMFFYIFILYVHTSSILLFVIPTIKLVKQKAWNRLKSYYVCPTTPQECYFSGEHFGQWCFLY